MGYHMDLHCEMIMDEYRQGRPQFDKILELVRGTLNGIIKEAGIYINAVEARVKEEKSLAGKLELKGYKYKTLSDITDIVGARVITFYSDEVDKIAALVETKFDIDWDESVDKRKLYEDDRFGYMSLHYICRIPKDLFYDENMPLVNEMRFEIQMRTALQHVWATVNHDTGYKSDVEVPREYFRSLNRLAGLLEIADEEFKNIKTSIEDYRRKVLSLVKDGRFDEVELDGDSFKTYLELKPYEALNKKIASINHAEIQPASEMPYLVIFKRLGMKTLADLESLKKEYSEAAYEFALHQIGSTDLDILSSTIGPQNLCTIYILKNGGGEMGIKMLYDVLYGEKERNARSAARVVEQAKNLNII